MRRKWKLRPQQKVIFTLKQDILEVKPALDFFSLKGSIKGKRKYSDKLANEAVGKHLARQYARENQNS
ncbi:hypothetical protein KKB83_04960 [Patescibacteria group bacterium]|nr:hypothetical protein [Patescibacteria group bacterium]